MQKVLEVMKQNFLESSMCLYIKKKKYQKRL